MYRSNRCRNCPHHHNYLPLRSIFYYDYDIGECIYSNHGCVCSGFIPYDNLEYLEWKYDRLENKNETAR